MTAPTITLAPDSFKGTVSALEVTDALAAGLRSVLPRARLVAAPMADGGEGTLDCIAAAHTGAWQTATIDAIHGQRIQAQWYRTDDGLAVIESARVLGLPLIENTPGAPVLRQRGSHALGMLMRAVLDSGARRIAVGLGGSACNDAGLGMLTALGCTARDADGQPVTPTMQGLLALDRLSCHELDPRLAHTDIRVLCDVDNPLLGPHGASRVYGPQKGLMPAEIEAVEAAFIRMASCFDQSGLTTVAGSGAAGGLGFALGALGAALSPGAQMLMEMTGLYSRFAHADMVITGEGRSDAQTLSGKLPLAIARAAAPVPTVLLSGTITRDVRAELQTHFAACLTLIERAGSVDAARAQPLRWIREAAREIGTMVPTLVAS